MIYKCKDCDTECAEITSLNIPNFKKDYDIIFWHEKINGFCWPWKTYCKIKVKKDKK